MSKVQVDIIGISTSPSSNGAYALILQETDGNRRLPIVIGAFEAQAIALEMENIHPPRPMTHDLMKAAIEALGASLVEVTINDLNDGTFYAQLILDSTGVEIDSRPSDAIALAVRFQAPIFVKEEVMNEASFVSDTDGEMEFEEEEEDEILNQARRMDLGDEESEETLSSQKETPSTPSQTEQKPQTPLEALQLELSKAIAQEDYEKAALIRDEIAQLSNEG